MDRREQIAHLAATREEEMLLVRVCEKLDTAVQRGDVLPNQTDAGRTRLHLEQIPLSALEAPEQKTKQIRGTVSSLRLDGVVAEGFALSRSRAAEVIAAGKTELNYMLCTKPDRLVAEGDVISVRGLGKMRLEAVGGNTKKGRISIEICRYI